MSWQTVMSAILAAFVRNYELFHIAYLQAKSKDSAEESREGDLREAEPEGAGHDSDGLV